MDMPGRSYTAEAYRYGYQGSERDRNMQGGTGYTTFFRSLDPRLGRWLNPDPKKFPWQSPYCSMDCNPVALTDGLGDESLDEVTVVGKGGSSLTAKGLDCGTVDSKTLAPMTSAAPSIVEPNMLSLFDLGSFNRELGRTIENSSIETTTLPQEVKSLPILPSNGEFVSVGRGDDLRLIWQQKTALL